MSRRTSREVAVKIVFQNEFIDKRLTINYLHTVLY